MKTKTIRIYAVSLFASLMVSCGEPELFVEIELPRVCITSPNIEFVGVPLGANIDKTVDVPIDKEIPFKEAKGAEIELKLLELAIIPISSETNLSGIHTLQVSLAATDTLPEKNLFSYEIKSQGATNVLVARGDSINIMPYLFGENISIRLVAIGKPPSTSWKADIKVCLAGKNRVSYLEQ